MSTLEPVPISPMPIERFRTVLDDQEYADLLTLAENARALTAGHVVWCVSSTAQGGGVAEMLRSLLAFSRGAGVDARWVVLRGAPEFFALTKRLHHRLHGADGDGGPVGDSERAVYEAVCRPAAEELTHLARPGDVVILHDPQTAGMAPFLREAGLHGLVWRAHVGVDEPNGGVREAWDFLRPYVRAARVQVFSRERFVWDGLDPEEVVIIPPSIDVFSAKNQDLSPEAVTSILAVSGLVPGGDRSHATFQRSDGSPGRVDRQAAIVEEAPLEPDTTIVAQVSRWDRLKDPVGVLHGYVAHAGECSDAHLLLVGPSSEGVSDDPEGAGVLAEVVAAWRALPRAARARVHLASLPMEDAEENAAIVNAVQRRATVIVQKSLAEGFGLTAAEALWKARPMVASGVGGLQDQVTDEVTGLVVAPDDLAGFGHAICRLLEDPRLARRLGAAGRDRVREQYLEPRHLAQWVDVIQRLGAPPAAVAQSYSARNSSP
jgi:trehalose synthase